MPAILVARRSLAVGVLTAALVALGAVTGPAHAATHRVLLVPRTFATIQAAVDAAAPGDTVNVGPGTYTEQVVINKDLDLHGAGAGATVIKSPAELAAYGVNTNSNRPLSAIVQVGRQAKVRMSGLGVTGPVPCTANVEGVGVVENADLDMSDSRVSQLVGDGCATDTYGIVIGVSPSYAINGVPGGTTATGRISHVVVDTYQVGGIIAVGPYGRQPSRMIVTNSSVIGGTPVAPAAQVGIWVRLNAVGQITDNTVSGAACTLDECGPDFVSQIQSAAVVVEGGQGSTFTGNHLSGGDFGLLDYNSAGVTISANTLVDNNDVGILIGDTDAVTKDNSITGGQVGIGVIALSQDTSELSSGDRISGSSISATRTSEYFGFHARLTVKP